MQKIKKINSHLLKQLFLSIFAEGEEEKIMNILSIYKITISKSKKVLYDILFLILIIV